MPKVSPEIRILSEDVANKIAAGEVVERPASVVKELLENAIDAGATRIEIEFKRGGKTLVRVRDNGCGMTRSQALTSLEPHATSKISSPDDIFKISSYGFRGEALPSIASVSKFTMRTRSDSSQEGVQIDISGGEVSSVKECGMARGTEICVENLFFGVPARRKFLKSDNVEASHIIRLCRLYGTLLPDVCISLVENSRLIFRSEANMTLKDRISRVFGREISSALLEIPKTSDMGFCVSGAISKVGESFATNRNICVFINSRPVDCRAVSMALKESFRLPKGRYAAAFLFIETNPSWVDVNVHPAKREVRLKDEFALKDFLCAVFQKSLNSSSFQAAENFAPSAQKSEKLEKPSAQFVEESSDFSVPSPVFAPSPAVRKIETVAENFEDFKTFLSTTSPLVPPRVESHLKVKVSEKFSRTEEDALNCAKESETALDKWRYLAHFKQRVALFQAENGLVMMSLINAQKRVAFEKILADLQSKATPESQQLLIPVNIGFERAASECFEAAKKSFEACGFGVENFGRGFYRIVAAPPWLPFGEVENFVRDFVELARDEGLGLSRSKMSDEVFASLAVKKMRSNSAECTREGALSLLDSLLKCRNHAVSPDGRLTLKEISDADFTKFFS